MTAKRWLIAVLVLGLAAAGGVAAVRLWNAPVADPVAETGLPTAKVVRTTMADRTETDGTLGYAGSYVVTADSRGRLTRLPAVGEVIERGQSVYEVDGRKVPLFYGSKPFWRTLSVYSSTDEDVEILQRNLKRLGYGDDLTVDGDFDWKLREAVEQWQDDLGVSETGVVAPGDVVVLPKPIRVTELRASPGLPAAGVVLEATGTTRQVEVEVPVGSQHLVKEQGEVTVQLPGGTRTTGHVASVGTVAVAGSQEQTGEGTETATVTVLITLDKPAEAGRLDGAPVTVGFAGTVHEDVLAVPVAALLATPGGGYRVRVVGSNGPDRTVPVEIGIFSEGKVEVEGDLTEGTKVRVPAI